MNGFRRTTSGLRNQHIFHNSDLIVFVEGGKSQYTKEQVYNGEYNSDTEDIIYWKKVFEEFINDKKIKFKSVGSKSTIKEIADDVIDKSVQTVFVAMDNEFDEILNNRINHSNVFYTYGYSYENDVWESLVIKDVIEELLVIEINEIEIKENFESFIKEIKLGVFADGYKFSRNSSFFPRKTGHMFCIDCNPIDLPSVKKTNLKNKLDQDSFSLSTFYRFGRNNNLDSKKHCFGHLLADYCVQLIINYLKNRHQIKHLPKKIIFRMGLNKFFQNHFVNSDVYKFHKKQFGLNGA